MCCKVYTLILYPTTFSVSRSALYVHIPRVLHSCIPVFLRPVLVHFAIDLSDAIVFSSFTAKNRGIVGQKWLEASLIQPARLLYF